MAIVKGEEITSGELRTEAAARDTRTGGVSPTPPELLQTVIDRKLWAQAARGAGRDRDIDFLLARRRLEETLLSDLEIRALRESVAAPADEDVDRFLQKNPTVFMNQTLFSIDQVTSRPGGDPALRTRLSKATSLDEVSAILSSMNVVGQRSRTEWNSLFMPGSLTAKLGTLSPDSLFFHRDGDTVIAANVVGKITVPLSYSDRRTLVRQSLMQQTVSATLATRLNELRASAGIRRQSAFAPASPP